MPDSTLSAIKRLPVRVRLGCCRWSSLLCAGTLALACFTRSGAVWAQPGAVTEAANLDLARSVAVTGREAFNAGDYETALSLFRRAYGLFPAPTVVLYEARTLERMGKWVEALDAFERTTRTPIPSGSPAQFAEAIGAARDEGAELRARVPSLTVEVQGARADDPRLAVTLNGRALSAEQLGRGESLDPGTYRVVGSVAPGREHSQEVTLVPGQSQRVLLNLSLSAGEALASEPAGTDGSEHEATRRRRIPSLAYVAGGVGVAGVTAGVIAGLLANGQYEDAERYCENRRCAAGSPGLDAVDAFRTWRMVSSVSYGVGAAGIAAGVVLWLTASDGDGVGQVGSIEPWGTANRAGVRGTF